MTEFSSSKTLITAGGSVLYPSLTDTEMSKIMQFVAEQDRERRLTVGRMRYMMSYWIRRGSDRNDHPISKATAETARSHVSTLIREIMRLRESLWAIASNQPTATPAKTGNADMDLAYNLQATALDALKEPSLGPPDSVCISPIKPFVKCDRCGELMPDHELCVNCDSHVVESPEDSSTDAAARAMFTDDQLAAWEAMGRKTCGTCGVPLRPCPKGPGADEPGYVGFYPCKHDDEDPNG